MTRRPLLPAWARTFLMRRRYRLRCDLTGAGAYSARDLFGVVEAEPTCVRSRPGH